MIDNNKPTILLSRCIEGEKCRYDGTMAKNKFIEKLKPYVNIITVCPESDIGLPTPRETLRLIKDNEDIKLVFSKSGEEKTKEMIEFTEKFLREIEKVNIHGVIFKSKSPSCGVKDVKIYTGIGKASAIIKNASGIFSEKCINKFNYIPIEDDGRLTNYNIREKFLTWLFANFNFQKVEEKKSVNELIKFQSKYKYLLMSYSPHKQKLLGKIVGNTNNTNLEESLKEYKMELANTLKITPRHMRNVNMLLHLFGYFSKELSKEEKAFFLDNLEKYQNKKAPFSVPLTIIKSWAIRFNNEYLLNQSIFESFPDELIEVTDSGKGI